MFRFRCISRYLPSILNYAQTSFQTFGWKNQSLRVFLFRNFFFKLNVERNNRFIIFSFTSISKLISFQIKKKKNFSTIETKRWRERKKKEKMAIIHGMTCEEITIATLNIE